MKYKYKKQLATGALTLSLLIGGSSVFAASPQDLGIKNPQAVYQKQSKNNSARNIGRGNTVGTISAINGSGFTVEVRNMKTKAASSVDIKTDIATTYSKNGLQAAFADLVVGQKVIVSGTFDKTTSMISAKKVKITVAQTNARALQKTKKINNPQG